MHRFEHPCAADASIPALVPITAAYRLAREENRSARNQGVFLTVMVMTAVAITLSVIAYIKQVQGTQDAVRQIIFAVLFGSSAVPALVLLYVRYVHSLGSTIRITASEFRTLRQFVDSEVVDRVRDCVLIDRDVVTPSASLSSHAWTPSRNTCTPFPPRSSTRSWRALRPS